MGVAVLSTAMVETTYGLRVSEDVVMYTLATDGALALGLLDGAMAEVVESSPQQMHSKAILREHRVGDETDTHSADRRPLLLVLGRFDFIHHDQYPKIQYFVQHFKHAEIDTL